MPETTPKIGLTKPVLSTDDFTQLIDFIRGNADILDAYSEQPNSYTSGVSGFSYNTVKAALDALAGVRIVEKGSNANGTYVRWENGLQIAWHVMTGLGPINVAFGALYAHSSSTPYTWTFPAAFIGAPAIAMSAVSARASVAATAWASGGSTNTLLKFYLVRHVPDSTADFAVRLLATSLWK